MVCALRANKNGSHNHVICAPTTRHAIHAYTHTIHFFSYYYYLLLTESEFSQFYNECIKLVLLFIDIELNQPHTCKH